MITSGIAADRAKQRQSLAWIREQSLDPNCIESLANHDSDIQPHVIEFLRNKESPNYRKS